MTLLISTDRSPDARAHARRRRPSPSLIRRAGGQSRRSPARRGSPAGRRARRDVPARFFRLEPGDIVVHFSDGVTDVMDRGGQLFTRNGCGTSWPTRPAGVSAVGETILAAVRDHFTGRSQFDDITMVCFGRDPQ